MPQHTPGPWTIKSYNASHQLFGGGLHLGTLPDTEDCDLPNANLIAAAPDLLAALEQALEFLIGCDDGRAEVVNRTYAAKAAINKAKGIK